MGKSPGLEMSLLDPLLRHLDLPLRAAHYPLGFRLNLATNSREVIDAVAECWGPDSLQFDRPPIEMRVIVRPDGVLAPQPSFRSQGHLYSVVSDPDNFAVADLQSLFAYVCVSSQTAADHAWLRWFFIESLGYTLLAQRYLVPVHAACVARNGSGALLCGPSGAGKSTLSFACARVGWTYIADDCTWLLPESGDRMALGKSRQIRLRGDAPLLFPELAGWAERARPNGKLAMELPLGQFPRIQTATRCPVRCLVFLDRHSDGAARAEAMPPSAAVDSLLRDSPSYGDEVDAVRQRTLERLSAVPSYRLRYRSLGEGIELLSHLLE
ncbi:MAG: hypothetical protein LAP40_07390 [Acidobacteriia bacterium]|nr:hypothetical protein [Terriglobia bacterium]